MIEAFIFSLSTTLHIYRYTLLTTAVAAAALCEKLTLFFGGPFQQTAAASHNDTHQTFLPGHPGPDLSTVRPI